MALAMPVVSGAIGYRDVSFTPMAGDLLGR
jgi:hypothetical protein